MSEELIKGLLRAIDKRMVECRAARAEFQELELQKRLEDEDEDEDEDEEPVAEPESASCKLRDAVDLMDVLRKLIVGRSVREIHAAFGAPGDWGYETEIGAALSKLYSGEPAKPAEPVAATGPDEPKLEWTLCDGADENATRARCDWWILETKSADGGGVYWLAAIDPDPITDPTLVNGSFDGESRPQPAPTLRQAQLDAERMLRRSAERIVERLPFGGGALARLGLRRVPPQPNGAGEIAMDAMYDALREIVESIGGLVLTGTVHNVRESKARNVYFVLRAGRTSLACRMSSTQAKANGRPAEAATVRVRGVPTVFTERGEVQLDVLGIERAAT